MWQARAQPQVVDNGRGGLVPHRGQGDVNTAGAFIFLMGAKYDSPVGFLYMN